MNSRASARPVVTGVALIVLPLVALGLKMFSFGWLMVLLIMGPALLLLIGYVLQIVIAAHGFLAKRAVFSDAPKRPRIAAWVTMIGVLLLSVFMPDGGDGAYGSTLQVWLGAYRDNAEAVHAATDGLTEFVALIAAALWLGGFLWLVIEWIIALSTRSRARRA